MPQPVLTTAQVDQPGIRQPAVRPVTTHGQQQLLRLAAPLGEIAAVCSVTRAAVSQWRLGVAVPSARCMSLLELHYKIPPAAWRSRPDVSAPPPPAGQPAPQPPTQPASQPSPSQQRRRDKPYPERLDPDPPERPADADAPERAAFPELPSHASSLDHVDAMLRQVVAHLNDPNISAREHSRHLDQWRKLMAMRIQTEARAALLEDATIRHHPKWKALKSLIVDALLPYPDAARAVEAAIERAIGVDTQPGAP